MRAAQQRAHRRLFCSLLQVRLWELPTFAERGELSAVHDARALVAGGPGLIVSGDKHGTVKMWKWKPPA